MEANKLESRLEKASNFIQRRINSRILIWSFIWYIPAIPFQVFGSIINEIWGKGKRRRQELYQDKQIVIKTLSLLKDMYNSDVGLTHQEVIDIARKNEIDGLNALLQYWIEHDVIQFGAIEGYKTYTHLGIPVKEFENFKKEYKQIYKNHNKYMNYNEYDNVSKNTETEDENVYCPRCTKKHKMSSVYCDDRRCGMYLGKEQEKRADKYRIEQAHQKRLVRGKVSKWKNDIERL